MYRVRNPISLKSSVPDRISKRSAEHRSAYCRPGRRDWRRMTPHSTQFSQSNALRSGHTSLSWLAVNRSFVGKYSGPAGNSANASGASQSCQPVNHSSAWKYLSRRQTSFNSSSRRRNNEGVRADEHRFYSPSRDARELTGGRSQ